MRRTSTVWAKHREKILYLIIGGWNTVFGFALFWAMHAWIQGVHYLIILAVANEIAILNAFVGYRWIVFRSTGSIPRELLRFHGVYAITAVVGMGATVAMVELLKLDPVIANGISLVITVAGSYVGHRFFSFSRNKVEA